MSTLRVNNITDASGGSSSLSVPGAAKAWVNFNGSGVVAIRAQLNVSSITDNGVGDYTVNFTTALADVNYSIVSQGDFVGTLCHKDLTSGGANPTTTAVRFGSYNAAGSVVDIRTGNVSIFR